MALRLEKLCQESFVQLSDVAESLQKRANGIDAWLSELGNSHTLERRDCKEGTIERVYWRYGYMTAIRDALDFLARQQR